MGYLSPALALRCVELQAQQSGSDHAEPVHVDHVVCVLALVAENTAADTQETVTVGPFPLTPKSFQNWRKK